MQLIQNFLCVFIGIPRCPGGHVGKFIDDDCSRRSGGWSVCTELGNSRNGKGS
jgi:hypothetical protein